MAIEQKNVQGPSNEIIQPLDIIEVKGDTLRNKDFELIPKNRPFIVLSVSNNSPLRNIKPIPGYVHILQGTSQIHQMARDGVLISPKEIISFGGFAFKDTVFRKDIVYAISVNHASELRLLGRIRPEKARDIIIALDKFL